MNPAVHPIPDQAQDAAQPLLDAPNGSQDGARSEITGLPPLPNRVRRRAVLLIGGRELAPEQYAMVAVTAYLIVHLERVSARLLRDGELRQDGEPKATLARVQDLAKQIAGQLADIFGGDAGDPAAKVIAGE